MERMDSPGRGGKGGGGTFDPLNLASSRGQYGNIQGARRRFNSETSQYLFSDTNSPILSSCEGAKRTGSASKTELGVLNIGVEDAAGVNILRERAISAFAGTGAGEGASSGTAKSNNSIGSAVSTESQHTSDSNLTGDGEKGWEYWGYRVLLLAVAAIMGTNFPVVSYSVHCFILSGCSNFCTVPRCPPGFCVRRRPLPAQL